MMDESLFEQNPDNFTVVTDSEIAEMISNNKTYEKNLLNSLHIYEINED